MGNVQNRIYQAWIWAIVINAIIFGALQVFLMKTVTKADVEPEPPVTIAEVPVDDTGPGGTFGQITHLIDDTSTPGDISDASEGDIEEPVVVEETEIPEEDTPVEEPVDEDDTWEIPEAEDTSGVTVTGVDEPVVEEQTWHHHEFYLDRGELISFAPRLNEDGSLRAQTTRDGRPKAPTYEDLDETFDADDLTPPKMEPEYFSSADLPEEYRDLDFDIRLRIHVNSRGRVLGTPEIIRGSGYDDIDRYVINKILNDVTFQPARQKDTGEPKTVWVVQPIFFE